MKIHEYQGKEILRRYAVPVPRGIACFSVDEAVKAAQELGGPVWVVKAQIHAGGRGKGGGVKLARSIDEVRTHASNILGMMLKTHQTGADGQKVRRLLIEEGADIRKELYLGIVLDRLSQKLCVMASSEGGMDIEEVAAKTPEKLHKVFCDVEAGLTDEQADDLAQKIGIPTASLPQARAVLQGLYKATFETDASLAEINPLILTGDGRVVALDAKMNFDANALFRHPDIVAMRDLDEEDPAEIEASKFDLAYIQLDGNIGCLVNGAGLAMATMDTIKLFGGEPANFLDVGGGATTEKVTEAFKIMLRNPGLKAILVNIFGGIMRCDTIAEGVVAASRTVGLNVPLVVRMKGTNEELGKKILADSGLPIIAADTMAEAARRVVSAAAGRAAKPASRKSAAKSTVIRKSPKASAGAAGQGRTTAGSTRASKQASGAKDKKVATSGAVKSASGRKSAASTDAAQSPVVRKATSKKAVVKKAAVKKAVVKKAAVKKTAAVSKTAAGKKTAVKQIAAKKTSARSGLSQSAAAKAAKASKTGRKTASVQKAGSKKVTAKPAASKKTALKTAASKKTASKKAASKPAKKVAPGKPRAGKSAVGNASAKKATVKKAAGKAVTTKAKPASKSRAAKAPARRRTGR